MKVRAGIVGPNDSVQFLCNLAKEYEDKLIPVPFTYANTHDTTQIVEENQQLVDIWIFSGQSPYTYAKKSSSTQPFYFLEFDGSSLAHTLVRIGYNDRKNLNRISTDLMRERDVLETYRDLGIAYDALYHYEYQGYTPMQEILDFHYNLFLERKVDVCITCLRYVYEQLLAKGVPAYRATPTRANARGTIEAALQQWETLHFKQSQIAIMLIKIEKMEKMTDHQTVSYDLHRLNLDLQSTILNFSESISGSFVALGIGTYIIFSTRGSLSETGEQSVALLENLSLITDLPSNIGIGYGETSLAAEEHARLALHHAQNYGPFCSFLVDSKRMIEGPLQEKESISFGYRNDNLEISEKLRLAGVTITTFNKMLSVQKNGGNQSITAATIAEWLKMTQRNARRILNSLVEHELAEIVGEEAPVKGRPRKIYRVGPRLKTTETAVDNP